jgi:hypothetical protein
MPSQSCRPVCHVPLLFQLIWGGNKLFEIFFSIVLCWIFLCSPQEPLVFLSHQGFVLVQVIRLWFSITELLYLLLVHWTELRSCLAILRTICLKSSKRTDSIMQLLLDATAYYFQLTRKVSFIYCLFFFKKILIFIFKHLLIEKIFVRRKKKLNEEHKEWLCQLSNLI